MDPLTRHLRAHDGLFRAGPAPARMVEAPEDPVFRLTVTEMRDKIVALVDKSDLAPNSRFGPKASARNWARFCTERNLPWADLETAKDWVLWMMEHQGPVSAKRRVNDLARSLELLSLEHPALPNYIAIAKKSVIRGRSLGGDPQDDEDVGEPQERTPYDHELGLLLAYFPLASRHKAVAALVQAQTLSRSGALNGLTVAGFEYTGRNAGRITFQKQRKRKGRYAWLSEEATRILLEELYSRGIFPDRMSQAEKEATPLLVNEYGTAIRPYSIAEMYHQAGIKFRFFDESSALKDRILARSIRAWGTTTLELRGVPFFPVLEKIRGDRPHEGMRRRYIRLKPEQARDAILGKMWRLEDLFRSALSEYEFRFPEILRRGFAAWEAMGFRWAEAGPAPPSQPTAVPPAPMGQAAVASAPPTLSPVASATRPAQSTPTLPPALPPEAEALLRQPEVRDALRRALAVEAAAMPSTPEWTWDQARIHPNNLRTMILAGLVVIARRAKDRLAYRLSDPTSIAAHLTREAP